MNRKVEYSVRKVTRYIVTEYHEQIEESGGMSGGCATYGEYDHIFYAEKVAQSLADADPDAKYIGVKAERE